LAIRYQLRQSGFFFDQWYVPQGTILDSSSSDFWSMMVFGRGLGIPPPRWGTQPLNQETYDLMISWGFPSWEIVYSPADNIVPVKP
jgi:hypothetical protein